MKITLIFTLLFVFNISIATTNSTQCSDKNYLFESVIEYTDYESLNKKQTTESLSYFTIREKYSSINVTALNNRSLKKVILLGENLEVPFLIKGKTSEVNISTLNLSLYSELEVRVFDTKGQTCEMVFAITRD